MSEHPETIDVVFGGMPANEYGGLRYGETDTHFIDLMPMIYTVRIVLTPKADPSGWDRGWCYPDMLSAWLAARVWDPATQDRPTGWVKEAHTGERPNGEVLLMPVYERWTPQRRIPWRDRPTWHYLVLGFTLLVLSPLIVLAVLVALTPWGLGSIAVVVLLWAAVHYTRARTGTLPREETRED